MCTPQMNSVCVVKAFMWSVLSWVQYQELDSFPPGLLCNSSPTVLSLTLSDSASSILFLSIAHKTGLSADIETMPWISVWAHVCQCVVTSGKS